MKDDWYCRAIEFGQFAQGVIASVWNPLACMLIGCADVDQDGARVDKPFGFDRADCWQAHIILPCLAHADGQ